MHLEREKDWAYLDALLFAALERHLGREVVQAEREHLRSKGWPTLFHPEDPSEPLYSLDAMVRAWKTATGQTALR
jgi:hypothetical protein